MNRGESIESQENPTDDTDFAALLRAVARSPHPPDFSNDPHRIDEHELEPGRELGNYRVIGPLGRGATSVVVRALDLQLGREVAVKVTRKNPDRLLHEARIGAALVHPNIAQVYEFGESTDLAWIAMEVADGGSLRGMIVQQRVLIREAYAVILAIAQGLAFAHTRGIVHRDLKPENLARSTDGTWKILDFGLADADQLQFAQLRHKSLAPPHSAATPAYASPRQLQGMAPVPADDVYAMGMILCELLTGRRGLVRHRLPADLYHFFEAARELVPRPEINGQELYRLLRRRQRKLTRVYVFRIVLACTLALAVITGFIWWRLPRPIEAYHSSLIADARLGDRKGLFAVLPGRKELIFADRRGLTRQDIHRPDDFQNVSDQREVVGLAAYPDGRTLLIQPARRISARPNLRRIFLDGAPPENTDWSCPGFPLIAEKSARLVCFADDYWSIRELNHPAQAPRRLPTTVSSIEGSAITRSGAMIAFVSAGYQSSQLSTLELDTGRLQLMLEDPALADVAGGAALAFDDYDHLYFYLGPSPNRRQGIYRWDTSGSHLVVETPSHVGGIYALDDERFIVSTTQSDLFDTKLVSLSGAVVGHPQGIMTSSRSEFPSAWTSDNQLMVMQGRGLEHRSFVVEPSRSDQPQPIPSLGHAWAMWPTAAPWGELLYFALRWQEGQNATAQLISQQRAHRPLLELGPFSVTSRDHPRPHDAIVLCASQGSICVMTWDDTTTMSWQILRAAVEVAAKEVTIALEAGDWRELTLRMDGTAIAVMHDVRKVIEIYTLAGVLQQEIHVKTACTVQELHYEVSGTSFVASAICGDDGNKLMRIDANGSVTDLLVEHDLWLTQPLPSPDGRYLAYAALPARYEVQLLTPMSIYASEVQ